ncbi:breast cancer metastasis-suppressor 1-like protein [Watersipora subatra]|uniref:breast cancer metastasis-suppressor 1-like protein n=1 Tax=Watersipora subatra TaxID=2589382 RepID=UPI00355AFEBB
MSTEERMDTEEEGEQESPNCDESDVEDSAGSSGSETESSDLDEETIDSRKCQYISEGHELEQAFLLVKNLWYEEKMKKIDCKLTELKDETSTEYLQPLKLLSEKLEQKLKVSLIRKDLRLELIKVQFDSEALAAHQNVENERKHLYDTVKGELEEKIRKLEEDRQSADINSDQGESQSYSRRMKAKKGTKTMFKEKKKKKPVVVTSPYVIYMLEENDILEDWALIKKALKQKQQQQKRPKSSSQHGAHGKDKFMARYHEGRLYYQGATYCNGHHIVIDDKQDSPVHASITALNPSEIWVRKSDGNKSKLYIAQLQKGKYTIKHSDHFRS